MGRLLPLILSVTSAPLPGSASAVLAQDSAALDADVVSKTIALQHAWVKNPIGLPRGTRATECWQLFDTCRELARHPALVKAAKTVAGRDAQLYLLSLDVIQGTTREPLHADLSLHPPACGGTNSTTVWALTQVAGELSSSPMRAVANTHRLTAKGILPQSSACPAPSDTEPPCTAQSALPQLQATFPNDGPFEIVEGPMRPGQVLAWAGQSWHEQFPSVGVSAVVVTYGTEDCVRAYRPPRWVEHEIPNAPARRWTSVDQLPLLPVDMLAADSRLPADMLPSPWKPRPAPFDQLITPGPTRLDADEDLPGACRMLGNSTKKLDINTVRPVGKLAYFLDARRASPVGEDGTRTWSRHFSTRHLSYLKIGFAERQSGEPVARDAGVELFDQVAVVLDGMVTYAASVDGQCGHFSAFDSRPGNAQLFLSGVVHTSAPASDSNGTDMVIKMMPRARNQQAHMHWLKAGGHLEGSALVAAKRAILGADAVDDPRVQPSSVTGDPAYNDTILWRVTAEDKAGYIHLLGAVQRLSPVRHQQWRSHAFDIIVVPIDGPITFLSMGTMGPATVEPRGAVVVPAGARYALSPSPANKAPSPAGTLIFRLEVATDYTPNDRETFT